jgi:hypothetical protein
VSIAPGGRLEACLEQLGQDGRYDHVWPALRALLEEDIDFAVFEDEAERSLMREEDVLTLVARSPGQWAIDMADRFGVELFVAYLDPAIALTRLMLRYQPHLGPAASPPSALAIALDDLYRVLAYLREFGDRPQIGIFCLRCIEFRITKEQIDTFMADWHARGEGALTARDLVSALENVPLSFKGGKSLIGANIGMLRQILS